MATTRQELIARLGPFPALTRAYRLADDQTKAQIQAATQAVSIGYITVPTYTARITGLLGVKPT